MESPPFMVGEDVNFAFVLIYICPILAVAAPRKTCCTIVGPNPEAVSI